MPWLPLEIFGPHGVFQRYDTQLVFVPKMKLVESMIALTHPLLAYSTHLGMALRISSASSGSSPE